VNSPIYRTRLHGTAHPWISPARPGALNQRQELAPYEVAGFFVSPARHGSTAKELCTSGTTVPHRRPSGRNGSSRSLASQLRRRWSSWISCIRAVAHGNADGVASNCYLELSATACGFAIPHVVYLSTETRNIVPAPRAQVSLAVGYRARASLVDWHAQILENPWSSRDELGVAARLRRGIHRSGSSVTAIDILLEPDATMVQHAQADNARAVLSGGREIFRDIDRV
jgi:hypothetical protein